VTNTKEAMSQIDGRKVRLFESRQVRAKWDRGSQLVSVTNQLKMKIADSKLYKTDVADTDISLVRNRLLTFREAA
jgi:hypothetical protein